MLDVWSIMAAILTIFWSENYLSRLVIGPPISSASGGQIPLGNCQLQGQNSCKCLKLHVWLYLFPLPLNIGLILPLLLTTH